MAPDRPTLAMIPDRPTLAIMLADYRQSALVAMVAANDLSAAEERPKKDRLVDQLAAHFALPAGIRARLAALDPPARAAFDLVHQAGGRMSGSVITEMLVEDGVATPPTVAKTRAYREPEPVAGRFGSGGSLAGQDVLARVEAAGLLLGIGPRGSSTVVDPGLARIYVIPAEVWAELPAPPPWPTLPLPPVTSEQTADPAASSRALFFLWAHLAQQRPALLQSGLLRKRDLKGAAKALGLTEDLSQVKDESELAALYLARLQLQAMGLAGGGPGQPVTCDAELARLFWSMSLAERVPDLVDAYLDALAFSELCYLPGTTWQAATRAERLEGSPAILRARARVLGTVAQVGESGAWVAVATLLRALKVQGRDFLVPAGMPSGGRYNYWSTPSHRYASGGNPRGWSFAGIRDEATGWQRVEGGFVRLVLGVLGRLGLLDLGLGPQGEVLTFRLSPWGRYALLEGQAVPADAAEGVPTGARLVVQPNFQVVALGPVPELTLLDLEQFTDRVSTDRAVTYTLSRESVYRGQQAGWDSERVLAWLAEASDAPLPQNVDRSIHEWQSLHERIVVRTDVRLLQARDAALLDRLATSLPSLERLAPTLALVPADSAGAAERALLALAETPRRLGARGAAPASLALDEAGGVTFRHKTPDFFTLGWLQRLAEPDGEGWRVTAGAARRAQERLGLSAEDQLARWSALCGEAPAGLATRLKAWTGHYGAAERVAGVVLQLPSQAVLDDLRAHKDLRAALKPLKVKGPLVTIPAADYARIAERLRELGLDVPAEDGD